MGMAASQARYLALTARKTNTEYEGQQINQARTALANQSANLFNRLLGLKVPNAPKTTDYTKLQYSYSDGANDSVLDNWQQLSTADSEYNYIVNHYYLANVYTGSKKLLNDPQVQVAENVATQYNWNDLAESMTHSKNPEIVFNPLDGTVKINGETVPGYTYSKYQDIQGDDKTSLDKALKNAGVSLGSNDWAFLDSTGTWNFMFANEISTNNVPLNNYKLSSNKPLYVGNCELRELTSLTEPEQAELLQILKDCPDSNMANYLQNDNGKLLYAGNGVYSFKMNGQTYFTCEDDLNVSINSQSVSPNDIDGQNKLAYYNASYIQKKIEEKNKALLETDGNGRFKSIKLDNDSVVYNLNTETITDEAAYQDAMNQYNYEVQQYEKTIADINAKTSIIQKEDRTLELRLKQLDTEQNALKTEMDAVKKVIKDNVESTFKTFSD